jgi:beta-galactosidase
MKHILSFTLLTLLLSFLPTMTVYADVPLIGAQVFIEPGQSDEEVDLWFRQLHDNGMTVCRIRLFEEYMKRTDGTWDFSLFDRAFRAADKYGIRVFGTLFPATTNNSVGGFKFPESTTHEKQIARYIREVVTHFRQFKSLYGWVLINEPGTGGGLPRTEYTRTHFEAWKQAQPAIAQSEMGYPVLKNGYPRLKNYERERFLLDYNTWYLSWLAAEIAKYDSGHDIHVNSHQIFDNVAEYDFPAWRTFLTSLGASIHPSWHFGYYTRSHYAAAVAANSQIIRSGAGKLPWWITELQGGNNTYSGYNAFCPTAEEVTQWLWTGIANGTQGIIFWCLNPRSVGEEAGEWALLNFQNQPSDRMTAAAEVARCLQANKKLFAAARPVDSHIQILYIRESLWIEKQAQMGNAGNPLYEGRAVGGVIKSALAIHETLLEQGVNANLRSIDEMDWTANSYAGQVVILANQIALPTEYWEPLRRFVRLGGKLIVEGLSAFYDENMLALHHTGFPLEDLFGGVLQEVKTIPGDYEWGITDPMPAHLWEGYIHAIGSHTATQLLRRQYGQGEVVWLPSLVALGARRSGNALPLSRFLMSEVAPALNVSHTRFADYTRGVIMSTMQADKQTIAVIVNKNTTPCSVSLRLPVGKTSCRLLFTNKTGNVTGQSVTLAAEETIVLVIE